MTHHKTLPAAAIKLTSLLAAGALIVVVLLTPIIARADVFEEQIRQKQTEQQAAQGQADELGAQADGIEGEIDQLQSKIAAIQVKIDANTKRQEHLKQQITEAQAELDEQRDMLAANIRSMYIEGDISPLEMVASSRSLGEFIDKQEYRDRLKQNITDTMDTIEQLKKRLTQQRQEVERILESQTTLRSDLAAKNAEADQKLKQVNQTKAGFDASVRQKAAEIAELREQQRLANARFIGAPGSGPACGGGYPGKWCNIPMDTVVDDWGMLNRECVSYTAFRVAASGRHMPYWGGVGNANQWDDNARAAGIPVNSTPRAGAVAISNAGFYGHAMYVESVNANGTINISQYNADWNGTYSYVSGISPAGLVFIHF